MTERRKITREEILAARTAEGGWYKHDLEQFGVPWPPPSGWFDRLIMHGVPYLPKDDETLASTEN